jgi:DNA-binding protein HU-beta
MTKVDLIDQVSQKTELPKRDVERMLEAAIAAMQQALTHGEKVSLTGLGVFTVADRKARVARNPKTGAQVEVPARKAAKFKPAKELKAMLG